MEAPARALAPFGATVSLILLGIAASWTAQGQDRPGGDEPALPENVVVDVDMIESHTFVIGIPDLLGDTPQATQGADILRNDFRLMPGYRVIPMRVVRHGAQGEGLGMRPERWAALHAKGVIKGRVSANANQVQLEMRFYQLSRGATPALQRSYTGAPQQLRADMHDFANEVIRTVSGELGPFGAMLTFARRVAPGRKDVMCAAMDGYGVHLASNGRGIAMLPSFDRRGNIWFTRLTPTGTFISRTGTHGRPVVQGNGLNMAPSICGHRLFFTSSRDGNSEIYSARVDGTDIRRLTNDPAIDVSPACGPGGKVAFVSTRHGSPQIWIMNADGSGQRRITYRGHHNQTPTFCQQAGKRLIAFTGRDAGLDIFTLNLATNVYTRLTQGQGMNKDPAFSPDCRIVAFASERRGAPGVYLSGLMGFNQNRVVEGAAETVRFSGRWSERER